ncbi:MAG: hypothetical protein ACOX9C_06235 [Kiritimatiellia bacterium]|jgi:hypothetical protein
MNKMFSGGLIALVAFAAMAATEVGSYTWTGGIQVVSTDTHVTNLVVNGATTVLVEKNATLTVDMLKGGGELTKKGNGALVVKDIDPVYANSGLNIVKGAFKLGILGGGVQIPDHDAWYHVDAMVTSKLHDGDGGVPGCRYWENVKGGGISSYSAGGVRPTLTHAFLGGRPVVDFGPFTTVQSEGSCFAWNTSDQRIRDVLIVASDTEDVIADGLDGQWFLGDHSGSSAFYRGTQRALHRRAPNLTAGNKAIYDGAFEIDGVAATRDSVMPAGFHVVRYRAVETTDPSQIIKASHWGYHEHGPDKGYGGIRIAEALVFTNFLDAADAADITEKLMSKWLDGPTAKTVGTLKISGDAEIEIREGDLLTVGTLTVDGELRKTGPGSLHANVLANSVGNVKTEAGAFTCGSASAAVGDVGNSFDVPANSVVAASRVHAEGTFTKTGDGTLNAIVLAGGVTNIAVEGGTFKVLADDGALPTGSRYHVDATIEAKLYLSDHGLSHGRIYSQYWEGVSGGSSFNARSNWPWIRRDLLGGRNCVDFGSYYCANTTPDGYGAGFNWNDAAKTVDAKGVFVIFADSDDVRESDALAGQNIVGCYDHGSFNRGPDHALLDGSVSHERLDELRTNGVCEINGVRTSCSTILPKGFHLVHMRLNAGSSKALCAQSWGHGRYSTSQNDAYYGGMKMAEGAIYTTDLTDAQVASATKYFLNKWFKQIRSGEYAFGTLTVANGATLDLDGRTVAATGLDGSGTIAAAGINLADNATIAVDVDADGAHKMTATGTVALPAVCTVGFNGTPPGTVADYVVLDSAGLTGSVADWIVDQSNLPANRTARVRVVDNKVVVSILAPGVLVVIK